MAQQTHATVTDLGPAAEAVNLRTSTVGELPDGTPVVLALTNGYPAAFHVVEVFTGRCLFSQRLTGCTIGSWVTQAPDGTVYLSARSPTPASLHRFDPSTWELEHIADRVGGESSLHSGVVDQHGRLWFGTAPHAKLMSYQPDAEGEESCFRDWRLPAPESAFAYWVEPVDDQIWVGTGPAGRVIRLDPATGRFTDLPLPEAFAEGTDWVIGISQRNDQVLVRLSPRGRYDTVVHDLSTGEWHHLLIPRTHGGMPSPVSSDGTTYLLVGDGEVIGFHTHSGQLASGPSRRLQAPPVVRSSLETYTLGLVDTTQWGLPGQSVVGVATDGSLWFCHIRTGQTRTVQARVPASAAEPYTIGTGPDDRIYLGAYLSSGLMVRLDPETGERALLRGPMHCDVITRHGRHLVLVTGRGVEVHLADPDAPWEWGRNPYPAVTVSDTVPGFHDLAATVVSVGDRLAIGTLTSPGQDGGALVLVDPATGDTEVHRAPVPGQSVVGLVHHPTDDGGLLIGSTSIRAEVALHDATGAQAVVFGWDLTRQRVVWTTGVRPGTDHIAGLTHGPDGEIAGTTSTGELFQLDPLTGRITGRLQMMPTPTHTATGAARSRTVYDPGSDSYLAVQSGSLVQVDRSGGDPVTLSRSIGQVAATEDGRVYGLDETNLYLITPG